MYKQNDRLIKRILTGYAISFIIIGIADSLTMIADSMIVSRGLGANALAALGLANPSYKIVSLFSGVLATGLQVLCAQAMGSGDRDKVNRLFSAGAAVMAAALLILTFCGFVFTDGLCVLFGAGRESEVYSHLYDYLRGWFSGIPGYIIFFVLSPLVTLDGNTTNVTVATFAQSAVNIVGDVLSMFVFDAGTYGVGLATGISYNIAAVILMLNFCRKKSVFRVFSAPPDFRTLPKMMNVGLPKLTEYCAKILAPLLINRTILAVGGAAAMSSISIKASIIGFCTIIGNGISDSVNLMTQILYSEKDAESLRKTVKTSLQLMLAIVSLFSLLLFIFAGYVVQLYLPAGTEEWKLAVQAVRCLAVSLVMNGCNTIIIKYLKGARKMLPVHLMTFAHRVIALTVFTALLGGLFGTQGLFIAIPVSEGAVLLGYIVIALLSNRGRGFWDSVMMIPNGFGYNSSNSCSFSIRTVEEAVTVSEQIGDFLLEHQIDKKTSIFSKLCIEELATNVIEHGFTKDKKKHYCDIRVMIEPDEVILRVRDNCPYFNIRERYDSLSKKDKRYGMGIRMVFNAAKDVNYISILKTNTLIIRM